MTNHIKQSSATIQQFTLAQLIEMPCTLHGDQHPLKESRVLSIMESFVDGVGLLQLLEVTTFEGTNILTGGRHRREALANEYAGNLDLLVDCLVYTAKDADEVVARVESSNGSRNMTPAEKKELNASGKYGFDVLSSESLIAKVEHHMTKGDMFNPVEAIDCFVLALAIELNSAYGCGKMTGLVVSRSLVTALKKFKQVNTIAPSYDTDGTMLAVGSTSKVSMLDTQLSMGTDRVTELVDALVACVEYAQYTPIDLPAKVYLDALIMPGVVEADIQPTIDAKGDAAYTTTVSRPSNWQRVAAKWVKVMTPMLKYYIAESIDITVA